VSPVKYELGFYITEDDILHSDRRENLTSYIASVCCSSCYSFSRVSTAYVVSVGWKALTVMASCIVHLSGVTLRSGTNVTRNIRTSADVGCDKAEKCSVAT
jgi:hypothetical protein